MPPKLIDLTGNKYKTGTLVESGRQHPKCYARRLNSCKGDISREHYISQNILKRFEDLSADGFPWLKGKLKTVSAASLTAKVLCEYHNNALSPLDEMVGRAFENLEFLLRPGSDHLRIWGPSLEQWMLKVLIGLVSAGQVQVSGKTLTVDDIDPIWINVLFGLGKLPDGQGVYMTPWVGKQINSQKHLSVSTLNLDGRLAGLRANLAGIEFLLSLADPDRAFNKSHPAFGTVLFRPTGIDTDREAGRFKIQWL